MKPENLPNTLAQLNKCDLCLVLLCARWLLLRYLAGLLRPIHLLIPVTLAQVALFTLTALNPDTFIPAFAAGNLAITALALLPSTIHRQGRRCTEPVEVEGV